MNIGGLFHPPRPSACLGGYVLTDQTHAWMLRVPFLFAVPGGPVLVPTLTTRFRSISGPYPLRLPSAKQAAQALGKDVFETGLTLAQEYINLLTAGQPVDDPNSWIVKGES